MFSVNVINDAMEVDELEEPDYPDIIMQACNTILFQQFGFGDPQPDYSVNAVHYFSDERPSGRFYCLSIGYSEEDTHPLYYMQYYSTELHFVPRDAGGNTIEELVSALVQLLEGDDDFSSF